MATIVTKEQMDALIAANPNAPVTVAGALPVRKVSSEEMDRLIAQQNASNVAPPAPEEPSGLHSFVQGAENGGTLGFRDKIAGLAGATGGYISQKGGLLPALGLAPADHHSYDRSFGDMYEEAKKENQADTEASSKAHPWLYGGGMVAGTILTGGPKGLGIMGAAPKGAVLGARLMNAGIGGAKLGALNGLGGTKALDDPNASTGQQIGGLAGDVVGNAAMGAASAVGGQLLGEGAGAALSPLKARLMQYANEKALKQLAGISGGGDKIPGNKGVSWIRGAEAAGEVRDMGINPLTNGAKSTLEKAGEMKSALIEKMQGIIPGLEAKMAQYGAQNDLAVNPDANAILEGVKSQIVEPLTGRSATAANRALAERLSGEIQAVVGMSEKNGTIPLSRLNQYRINLDENIRSLKNGFDSNGKDFAGQLGKLRSIINDEVMSKVGKAGEAFGQGDEGATLAALKKQYSSLSILENAAQIGADKAAKKGVGIVPILAGLSASPLDGGYHAVKAAVLAGGAKLAQGYGNGALSEGARALAGVTPEVGAAQSQALAGTLPDTLGIQSAFSGLLRSPKPAFGGIVGALADKDEVHSPMGTLQKAAQQVPQLQQAAMQGKDALASQHYVQSQQDPKYRQLMQQQGGKKK